MKVYSENHEEILRKYKENIVCRQLGSIIQTLNISIYEIVSFLKLTADI